MSETMTLIALLSQSGESGRHLRDALAGAGTPIVYEAEAAALDRDALERSGARVIVVNLDAEVEAHLDEVYALLGDDRYNVIFNEAQVSSQLSGWEQARWARHLAAKILGVENADPPRPEGAESVPQRPAKPVAEVSVAEVAVPVEAAPVLAPVIDAPQADPVAEPAAASETAADDFADILSLLDEVGEHDDQPAPLATDRPRASRNEMFETVPMPVLDFSEFDEPAAPPLAYPVVPEASAAIDMDASEIVIEVGSGPVDTLQMPAFDATEDALGFGDLDDFADGGDASIELIELIELDAESDQVPVRIDADLAEAEGASNSAAAGPALAGLELLDIDWADTSATPAADVATEQVDVPPEVGSAFSWSLEDLDEGTAGTASTPSAAPIEAREFGIEKISASEYLAPADDDVADEPLDVGLSLELIPLDEAVAPKTADAATDSAPRESWLDPSAVRATVTQVWVLGASIGGPEAVREFLAELPKNCPALFLLAQHMGAEFMEIMAQQLSRSTVMTVRTPTHGERVGHGDIVVVPTTHRLRVDREGVVTLEPLVDANQPNTPSIDQVLRDVADRFGAKAGVIVFSGMAADAAEGSRYLAEIGGKVYVQDPETCVISSMVDGVIETGVVSFAGSPKALAGKVLGDLKVAAKT